MEKIVFVPVYERDAAGNLSFAYLHSRLILKLAKKVPVLFCSPGDLSYVKYDWMSYWNDILFKENISTIPINFRYRYDFDERTLAPLQKDLYEWRCAYTMDVKSYLRVRRALLRFRPSPIETKIFSYKYYDFEFRGVEKQEMVGSSSSKFFYPSVSCQYLKDRWLDLLRKYYNAAQIKNFDKLTPVHNVGIDISSINTAKEKFSIDQDSNIIVLPYELDALGGEDFKTISSILDFFNRTKEKIKNLEIVAFRYSRENPGRSILDIKKAYPFLRIIENPYLDWATWYEVCCKAKFFLCPVGVSLNCTYPLDLLYTNTVGLFVDDRRFHYLENYPYIVSLSDFKKLCMVLIGNEGYEKSFERTIKCSMEHCIKENFDLDKNLEGFAEYIYQVYSDNYAMLKP